MTKKELENKLIELENKILIHERFIKEIIWRKRMSEEWLTTPIDSENIIKKVVIGTELAT